LHPEPTLRISHPRTRQPNLRPPPTGRFNALSNPLLTQTGFAPVFPCLQYTRLTSIAGSAARERRPARNPGPPLGIAPSASVADSTPTAATATAHFENQDHHNGDDGRDSNPKQGSTKNTLHDRHPSLGCPHEAGSTFTPLVTRSSGRSDLHRTSLHMYVSPHETQDQRGGAGTSPGRDMACCGGGGTWWRSSLRASL
jgi:hypothetical protein